MLVSKMWHPKYDANEMLAYPSPIGQMIGRLLAAFGSGTFPGPRPDFFLLERLLEVDPEPSEASMSPDSVASGSGASKSTPTSPSDDDDASVVA